LCELKKISAATQTRRTELAIRKKLVKNERQAAKEPQKQWAVDQLRKRLPAASAKASNADLDGGISKKVQPSKDNRF